MTTRTIDLTNLGRGRLVNALASWISSCYTITRISHKGMQLIYRVEMMTVDNGPAHAEVAGDGRLLTWSDNIDREYVDNHLLEMFDKYMDHIKKIHDELRSSDDYDLPVNDNVT